jgi:peptide/nickel transport system permease protein
LGVVLGMTSGFFGGVIDAIIMRICEVMMAIPSLILAIAVVAVFGQSTKNLIIVMSITGWVHTCKILRNGVRVFKNQEFVFASRALGAPSINIMFAQIFPNVVNYIIIIASQRVGLSILIEAGLSFLNMGIAPPTPSWGNMISVGRTYMTTQPWMVFAPGLALMCTAMGFNFLGNGLSDVLDPKRSVVRRRRAKRLRSSQAAGQTAG